MGNGRHAVGIEQLGKQPHHHLAVFQHVAHTAGHAQVVLQHVVLAIALRIGGAHDVNTRDVRINLVRHIDADHLGAELGVVLNLLARHNARLDDLLVVVNVVDESVERRDALHQPFLHAGPLVRGNDAGNQVKRNQPLGASARLVLFTIDGKGNAHASKDHFGLFAPFGHHVARLARQPGVVDFVVVSDLLTVREELIRQAGVHLVKLLHKPLS